VDFKNHQISLRSGTGKYCKNKVKTKNVLVLESLSHICVLQLFVARYESQQRELPECVTELLLDDCILCGIKKAGTAIRAIGAKI